MQRLYKILHDMGVDPATNGLAATPGGQRLVELVRFLRIPEADLKAEYWSTIEANLRRWASERQKTSAAATISVKDAAKAAEVDRATIRRAANGGKIQWIGKDKKNVDELSFRRWQTERQADGRANPDGRAKSGSSAPSFRCNVCRNVQSRKGQCDIQHCNGICF
jgi:hypothetical protein